MRISIRWKIVALVLALTVAFLLTGSRQYRRDESDRRIKVGALCYHKFYTQQQIDAGKVPDDYTITAEEFEAHLQYLAENNITVITAQQLLDYIDGKIDLPQKCMLLTVDDCSISFYENAYPLLQKYGVKVNAAIIGNRADSAQQGGKYRSYYCTWDELREMEESGLVEFGAHTYYLHDRTDDRYGTMLKETETVETYRKVLKEDLQPLNQKIQDCVGYTPNFFVYPFYAVSMPSIPILRDDVGFRLLFGGNSESLFRYCGESVPAANYNAFQKGVQPDTVIIKRYTPRLGEDFAQLIDTIFEESPV